MYISVVQSVNLNGTFSTTMHVLRYSHFKTKMWFVAWLNSNHGDNQIFKDCGKR